MAHQEKMARQAMDVIPWWRSIIARTVALYILVPSLLLGVGIWRLHVFQQVEIQEKFGLALQAVAASTAPHLSGDALTRIHTNAHAALPEFQALRETMETARRQNGLTQEQIYIIRPASKARVFSFAVMLQEATFVGDEYHPPEALQGFYDRVLGEGSTQHSGLYTDAHGMFISGLAPVRNGQGEVVAILQVDYGVDRYLEEVSDISRRLVAASVGVLLVLLLIGLAVHIYMRRRFARVLDATIAIVQQDYGHRVELSGSDELSRVGEGLDQALEKLRERFEMLKFLPRHTSRMISRRVQQGDIALEDARRVRVAVVETDIRGFTKLSESMEPEEVIAMLNTYVRVQAEVIDMFEGSIDKYMGDAVLAIFEGEEVERRALECVFHIQESVNAANQRGAFRVPVRIGVGLSVGEVVMGNMGSHQRMEHTVIGSVVNLAARLCSAAGPGEIVFTADFERACEALDLETPELELIRAKGFSAPLPCYRIQVIPHPEAPRLA